MSKEKLTPKFDEAKQIITVAPLSVIADQAAFIYRGFFDLKNLLAFVGSKPMIDENSCLWFGKFQVAENSVILRTAQGHVSEVLTFDKATSKYAITSESNFLPEHANVVQPKVVKEGSKRSANGKSRADYVVALKAQNIEFDARASKDQLIATFEAAGGVI